MRLRTHRAEHVDQSLERHVGVREGREVGAAHLREQFGERRGGIDRTAQHQRVDEHADQVVDGTLTATGDRCADGDVGTTRQPARPGGERGVHDHEQRCPVRACQIRQRGVQLGVDREAMRTTGIAGDLGAGTVGGQLDLIGQIAQLLAPVVDLRGRDRLGVVFAAEHLALPQRVIRVLHRQRRPPGRLAARTLGVGDHHIAQQWTQRETVAADVMHDQHRDVLARTEIEQGGAEGDFAGDVEVHAGEFDDLRGQFRRGHRVPRQFDVDLRHRQNALVANAVDLGVDGAQRFVPCHHVTDRGTQGVGVQLAGQPHGDRNVVDGGVAVEPVEEPHPLLSQRQRNQFRPLPRHQRQPRADTLDGFGPGRERGDGRRLEQHADRDLRVQCRAEARGELGGDQRVATEGEEVVVQADPLDAE
ncbi:hypothetical protein GCM10023318_06020 [Nocardia callitridis]|uniref:Uncharacterized protein n=1 Tax=Nocardia callitridis TaxID=648753 RepID=A0ABP9JT28_9NOCA